MRYPIEQVWVEQDAANSPLTQHILQTLATKNVRIIKGPDVKEAMTSLLLKPDPISRGKRIIRLVRHKGRAVRPCPGTRHYVCCHLQILHLGQGCPIDCRYCALQAYLNSPVIDVFVNREDILKGLDEHLIMHAGNFHRICTGEFTDSLALEPLLDATTDLVDFFSKKRNACLELKTKTDHIEPLLKVNAKGHVVVSFSVNANQIIRGEELFSASLHKRLQAAKKLAQNAYKIGFHFDPIIPIAGWKHAYCQTVQEISAHVRPESIAWISMGVLRFVPELKEIVLSRFGRLKYFHDAFVRGLDGKFRICVQERIKIYRTLFEYIRSYFPNTRVYLCMESPYVWEQALGMSMKTSESLREYLDAAVR